MERKYTSIKEYVNKQPKNIQDILMKIYKVLKETLPEAEEKISYGMPTFDINRKHAIHFAAFKNHIGIFPTPSAIENFKEKLKNYKTSKGTIQFPFDDIRLDLLKELAEYRKNEVESTS